MGDALPSIYAHHVEAGAGVPADDTGFPTGSYVLDVEPDIPEGEDPDPALRSRIAGRWVISIALDEVAPQAPMRLTMHHGGRRVATGRVIARPSALEITSSACGPAVGRYGWAFDGTFLRLHDLDDPCEVRRELLSSAPLERRSLAMRFMDAFDATLAPIVSSLDNLEAYVDPGLAPSDFVDWLCTWVAFSPRRDAPLAHRRAHVRRAVQLLRAWGTAAAIRRFVSIFAGVDPDRVSIEENGGVTSSSDPRTPMPGSPELGVSVRVRLRPGEHLDPRHLDRLVAVAKPAHVPHRTEVMTA